MGVVRPLVSIITGTFNRLSLLKSLFESVRLDIPDGMGYEFIVCDGGSDDGTIDWLKAQPDTVLIEHGELRGAIPAFTDCGKLARGKYTLILNDDVSVIPGSILRSIVYLEENPRSGMVAYLDNRGSPYHTPGSFHTLQHMATKNGMDVAVTYGQCCLVRTWLGQHVNWWKGYPEQDFKARTYAGDNLLSSNIWALGYTVDAVDGCRVHDTVHPDGLRDFNNTEGRSQEDSAEYYRVMPTGAAIPDTPQIDQQDKRQLRILYLPLYEPGFGHYKSGLKSALGKPFIVLEHDYLQSGRNLTRDLLALCDVFQPDMILSQIHDASSVPSDLFPTLRAHHPRLVIVNWNGDYWPDKLTSQPMIDLLRHVDLQLVVNASVIETYKAHHIPAAYWQIGYEDAVWTHESAVKNDVVFLANAYSDKRQELGKMLHDEFNAWIVGSGWHFDTPNSTYDFAYGAMVYQHAKLSIGDNQFPDAYGFVSNRIFQALAAGGALLLHQHVPGLKELTGLQGGVHFIEWKDTDELRRLIKFWLAPEQEADRKRIADYGMRYTREYHSFDRRVQELFGADGLIKQSRRTPNRVVPMMFIGSLERGGFVGPVTRRSYEYVRERVLMVDQLDVEQMVASGYFRKV